ncbi:hypothetical protein D3C72_1234570 [compost metagenome]
MAEQQAPQQQARARTDGQAQAAAQRWRAAGAGVGRGQQVVLAHGRSLAQFRGDGIGLAQADAVDGACRWQGGDAVVDLARIVIIKGAEARAADARGRIDGFLQQGRQIEGAGQGRARIVEQLEHARFIAQGFLRAFDLVDIGARAKPAQQLAAPVVHGIGARQEPAVLAVCATDGELHFEGRAIAQGSLPRLQHGWQVLRVIGDAPAVARHLFGSGARVVVPALVVPGNGAVEAGDPGQLRDGIGQRAQVFLAVAQVFLGRLALADVLDIRGQAIAGREDAHFQPAPQRRIQQFETAAVLLRHGAPVLRFQFRTQQVGAGLPQVLACQAGARRVLRRQHGRAARIEVADGPVAVEQAKAVGNTFQQVGQALVGEAQRR